MDELLGIGRSGPLARADELLSGRVVLLSAEVGPAALGMALRGSPGTLKPSLGGGGGGGRLPGRLGVLALALSAASRRILSGLDSRLPARDLAGAAAAGVDKVRVRGTEAGAVGRGAGGLSALAGLWMG